MIVELLVGGGAAALGLAALRAQARENRRAILRRIVERVEGELVSGWGADEVRGVHAERPFRLRLATGHSFGWRRLDRGLITEVYPLEVRLELLHARSFALRIRRDRGLAALEKRLGLARDVEVSGGDAFDQRFLVEAELPAASPLASAEVRELVGRLLGVFELDEVRLGRGLLCVRGRPSHVGPLDLHVLLDALEALARAFDRRPAPPVLVSPRFVWIGGADRAPRCPYCHEVLEEAPAPAEPGAELRLASETPLVACERCGTLLHRECFQDNHGCPLLGCGGRGYGPVGSPALPEGKALEVELELPPDEAGDEVELALPPEEEGPGQAQA